MNILDENIRRDQREMLRAWRVPVRQVGRDFVSKGVEDENMVPRLLRVRHATFFTRDADFFKRELRHSRYCLVYLTIGEEGSAVYVRRILRHPAFNTQAKRMGAVVRASPTGLTIWRLHAEAEEHLSWPR